MDLYILHSKGREGNLLHCLISKKKGQSTLPDMMWSHYYIHYLYSLLLNWYVENRSALKKLVFHIDQQKEERRQ